MQKIGYFVVSLPLAVEHKPHNVDYVVCVPVVISTQIKILL